MVDEALENRSTAKWGEAGRSFQLLPDILLKRQAALGLSATDMLVLINITMHWWYAAQRPFPRTTTIAKRMGVDARTVQRSLKKMGDAGLITREIELDENGDERTVCDLSGLVERLEHYAALDEDYRLRARLKSQKEGAAA